MIEFQHGGLQEAVPSKYTDPLGRPHLEMNRLETIKHNMGRYFLHMTSVQ